MLEYPPAGLLRKAGFLRCYKQIIEICSEHTLTPPIAEALAALEQRRDMAWIILVRN